MSEVLRAPYPYFGGKRRVADVVWRAFGADVPNFVDAAFGSNAILLARPGGPGKIETINDKDGFVANFWRGVKFDPEGVAQFADWPVNELDLHARHLWLVNQQEFKERLRTDPDYFDVKIAGWWVWGLCAWIGGGWCRESSSRKLPNLAVKADGACAGRGIHSEAAVAAYSPGRRPSLGSEGQGVLLTPRRKRPQLADGACGVHLPSLGNDRGINGVSAPPALDWFLALQRRLRNVRVACGDFERVLGDSVLGKGKNVGGRRPCAVFLDLPYPTEARSDELYAEDAKDVAHRAFVWALEHGDDPELRIAFCGYSGWHEFPGWTEYAWKGARGYAGEGNSNRELERIFFSPHCLSIEQQRTLDFGQSELFNNSNER